MRFESWEPLYLEILDDFGFSRDRDEEAARLLSNFLKSNGGYEKILFAASELIQCRSVVVCGNAPTLRAELQELL